MCWTAPGGAALQANLWAPPQRPRAGAVGGARRLAGALDARVQRLVELECQGAASVWSSGPRLLVLVWRGMGSTCKRLAPSYVPGQLTACSGSPLGRLHEGSVRVECAGARGYLRILHLNSGCPCGASRRPKMNGLCRHSVSGGAGPLPAPLETAAGQHVVADKICSCPVGTKCSVNH